MALATGTRLGTYEITGSLGAGGMGEVYRATDTKLGREVAIKTLPSALATDTDRLARFEREAKLLAALNHAHIAAIYGLDEHEGLQYLAMELVEGETLEEKLKAGPLPVEDALRLALQIAEALEAAHEKGVVHRDLKPANVMVTRNGVVKVLDFGLAKAFAGNPSEANLLHSPALSIAMTQQGLILGTAGYMSPEQASGQATDQRADIWAFGVVLYEMLTGMPLFSGESVPHVLADVLRTEPDWSRLPKNLHPRLKLLLERCLKKRVRNRYHSMADVRVDIEDVLPDPHGVSPPPAVDAVRRSKGAAWAVGASLLTAVVVVAIAFWSRSAPPVAEAPVTRSIITSLPFDRRSPPPAGQSRELERPFPTAIALSPDGRTAVVRALTDNGSQLFRRTLDRLDITPIEGTDGAEGPFFSPDGVWIGFWVNGELKRVPIAGGPASTIYRSEDRTAGGYGADWGEDDRIVFATRSAVRRVAAAGGEAERLPAPDAGAYGYFHPHLLPGDKAVLLTRVDSPFRWDKARVVVRSLETGDEQDVINDGADARYLPSGHLLFVRRGTLMAAPFDVARHVTTGGAVALVDGVMQTANFHSLADSGSTQVAVASNGTLLYATGGLNPDYSFRLVWVDRDGHIEPLPAPPRAYVIPRLTHDGMRVLVTVMTTQASAAERIWVYDLARGTMVPVTADDEESGYAVQSPDGARVVFESWTGGRFRLASQPIDGSSPSMPLTEVDGTLPTPSSWSRDGVLAFVKTTGQGRNEIWTLDMNAKSEPRPLIQASGSDKQASFSPDGRWIAYASNVSGRQEVYVQPYPGPGERVPVSVGGGAAPAWRADGRELFYETRLPGGEGVSMMAVPVETTDDRFSAGTPKHLFTGPFLFFDPVKTYDVTPDGQRFLMVQFTERPPEPPNELVLVQHWFEELKRLAPTN
jgi:eukaryotic-like serine/threonine-protein kinase